MHTHMIGFTIEKSTKRSTVITSIGLCSEESWSFFFFTLLLHLPPLKCKCKVTLSPAPPPLLDWFHCNWFHTPVHFNIKGLLHLLPFSGVAVCGKTLLLCSLFYSFKLRICLQWLHLILCLFCSRFMAAHVCFCIPFSCSNKIIQMHYCQSSES